ncbi:group II intron reverse transcriptase/maturase [Sphingobacterium litopenaei]|uniref:group II intron reverse transcriptase/maturase n=1 Tax=Sphingobacterium litopenaei TaxID=2763500 RepID=UPI001CC1D6DA|nr:group II intron reverse transcriptase/maturase [Sphingobacterium litopenaei]
MIEKNLTYTNTKVDGLLEQLLDRQNLNTAYLQVVGNRGAGGIDKMGVESLGDYLREHKEQLLVSIKQGDYSPAPVRRVEIPKDNGSKRMLGIPTVVDRLIQQGISQILTPIYEPEFSDHSYGFRPGRNAHQALIKCREYIEKGYKYAVDIDLEKFFDTVNHSKLIELLSRKIKDGRLISLIHRYLRAGVEIKGWITVTTEGVPQGGPLSPLLSNIMLDELDKELESRGHKFVRYADDLVILCRSKRSSSRVMESITKFVEGKLKLKVNKEKSVVSHVSKIKFLGYSFYNYRGESRLGIHPKSLGKMKAKIKVLTCRSGGWSDEQRILYLKEYLTGWMHYFKLADMGTKLGNLDMWYRGRLRMIKWKQWKRPRTKITNLVQLGANKYKAYEWANTRKSYWHIANSWILSTTLSNDYLKQLGYPSLLAEYKRVRVTT